LVVEKSVRAKQVRAVMASEAEDSARDDTQTSDADDEDIMISRAELKGFTQALAGAVQLLNVIVRKFKLDKDKDGGIREIGNLIKGILSSLEQCEEKKPRRRKRRREPAEAERREKVGSQVRKVMIKQEYSEDSEGWMR
jgi:hypothetical protein